MSIINTLCNMYLYVCVFQNFSFLAFQIIMKRKEDEVVREKEREERGERRRASDICIHGANFVCKLIIIIPYIHSYSFS